MPSQPRGRAASTEVYLPGAWREPLFEHLGLVTLSQCVFISIAQLPSPDFPTTACERPIETLVAKDLQVLSLLRNTSGGYKRSLRHNSWLRRRLRAEDALEPLAVLKKDQYPQTRSHQRRRNARRRQRRVNGTNVVGYSGNTVRATA